MPQSQLDIIRNVELASEDSMLSTLLQSISEIAPVEKESNSIDHVLLEVTSLVGPFSLNRVGILLPEAYQEFLNAALRHAEEMFFEQTSEFFQGAHKVRL